MCVWAGPKLIAESVAFNGAERFYAEKDDNKPHFCANGSDTGENKMDL